MEPQARQDLMEESIERADRSWLSLRDKFAMAAALAYGVPKELARVIVPVGRYSRMRATGNLRGWLGFRKLRLPPTAQWEIRQYAGAIDQLIQQFFPRTHAVACQHP